MFVPAMLSSMTDPVIIARWRDCLAEIGAGRSPSWGLTQGTRPSCWIIATLPGAVGRNDVRDLYETFFHDRQSILDLESWLIMGGRPDLLQVDPVERWQVWRLYNLYSDSHVIGIKFATLSGEPHFAVIRDGGAEPPTIAALLTERHAVCDPTWDHLDAMLAHMVPNAPLIVVVADASGQGKRLYY